MPGTITFQDASASNLANADLNGSTITAKAEGDGAKANPHFDEANLANADLSGENLSGDDRAGDGAPRPCAHARAAMRRPWRSR